MPESGAYRPADEVLTSTSPGAPEESDRLRALLDAVVTIGSDLSLPDVLRRIVESACRLSGARYGALGVVGEERRLSQFITVGLTEAERARIGDLPSGRGVLGLLIEDPQPVRLHDLASSASSYGFPAGHPPMSTFLGVPVHVRGRVFGNLYLTEKAGGADFTPEDEEVVTALAVAAGVAIDNAAMFGVQVDRGRLDLLEDRDRIARDLHDLVIQRLFATGLSLQGLVARITDPDKRQRVVQAVEDLDDTVREIRRAIFSLRESSPRGVRALLEQVVAGASEQLGSRVSLRVVGPVDTLVDEGLAEEVRAVVTEALSNVVRHSGATRGEVEVETDGRVVRVTVVDDGKGGAGEDRRSGLGNLAERASSRGGTLELVSPLGKGTRLLWSVPLG